MPPSKSHTIRAVAIASLAEGQSCIRKPLLSNDTNAAVNCYKDLGAQIDISDSDCWTIIGNAGNISVPDHTIDVLNSGTTLRIAIGSASLASADKTFTFTGDEQIRSRSVGPLIDALNSLGANCKSIKNNDRPPVTVSGQIKGGKTSIAATTSQYLSSLLLCTPLAQNDTQIDVTTLNEPGYVRLTLDWLDRQKIQYTNERLQNFHIKGSQKYQPFDQTIPADFSSATFFLCAGALLADEINLHGLDFNDSQPDRAVVKYLKKMGADINIKPDYVTVKAAPLKGTEIDMNQTPDALPAIAVTAAFAKGTTIINNVPQARQKETDRIKAIATELKKMAVHVEEFPDGLIIHPSSPKAAQLSGWGDHRIVMALAVAAMALEDESTIDSAEAVNVTFPKFVELMKKIGGNLQFSQE